MAVSFVSSFLTIHVLGTHTRKDRLRNEGRFLCDRSEGDQPPLAVVGCWNYASTIWPAKIVMNIYFISSHIIQKKNRENCINYNNGG